MIALRNVTVRRFAFTGAVGLSQDAVENERVAGGWATVGMRLTPFTMPVSDFAAGQNSGHDKSDFASIIHNASRHNPD